MSLLRAMISAAEMLPISGAAHLPWLLGGKDLSFLFDATLYLGAAVLVYFWRNWLTDFGAGLFAVRTRSIQDSDARPPLGTIPATLAGLLLETLFESSCSDPPVLFLPAAMSSARFRARYCARYRVHYHDYALHDLLLVKAVRLLPGLSRSPVRRGAGLKWGITCRLRLSGFAGINTVSGTSCLPVALLP